MSDQRPADDEQITQEFPAVADQQLGRRDGVLVWGGLGALVAIIALIVFADGLRSPGVDTPSGPVTTPLTTATADLQATEGTSTVAAPGTRHVLTVTATDTAGVATEVRSGDANGDVLFQGIIAQGASRRFTIPPTSTLWLSLAWAPSAEVAVNGVVQTTADGTAAFVVGPDGLTPAQPPPGP